MTGDKRMVYDRWWKDGIWQVMKGWYMTGYAMIWQVSKGWYMTGDERMVYDRWWKDGTWQVIKGWYITGYDMIWQVMKGWYMTGDKRMVYDRWWKDGIWQDNMRQDRGPLPKTGRNQTDNKLEKNSCQNSLRLSIYIYILLTVISFYFTYLQGYSFISSWICHICSASGCSHTCMHFVIVIAF
jgi:hypothetical protein